MLTWLITPLVLIFVYLYFKDPHIDIRAKIIHYLCVFYFWCVGASKKSSFNRSIAKFLDFYPRPSNSSGISSKDVQIEAKRPVTVRIYENSQENHISDALIIYIHGGGFVLGLSCFHDRICRKLVSMSGAAVLSIDYALCPEFTHPAAIEDCWNVLQWVKTNLSHYGKVVLLGDSAGANLCTVMMMKDRDEKLNLPISLCCLIYPTFFASLDDHREYYVLPSDMREFCMGAYFGNTTENLNPLNRGLNDLPSCMLVTCEYDVLKHDGNLFLEGMKKIDQHVIHVHYPTVHGFWQFPFASFAEECFVRIVKEIESSRPRINVVDVIMDI